MTVTRKQARHLVLISQGYTDREIAELSGVSYHTVKARNTQLMNKTGMDNRLEMTLFAEKNGLLEQAPINVAECGCPYCRVVQLLAARAGLALP